MKYHQTTLETEIAGTIAASRSNDRETAAEAAQMNQERKAVMNM